MSRRGRKSSGPPFVQLHKWLMATAAWQHLSPNDRCVYLALKARFNGSNNGRIAFSAREAGAAINASHHTGNRSLNNLVEHGFLIVTEDSDFNRKVKIARTYLLTELPDDRPGKSRIPSKDFASWKPPTIHKSVAPMSSTVSPVRLRVVN